MRLFSKTIAVFREFRVAKALRKFPRFIRVLTYLCRTLKFSKYSGESWGDLSNRLSCGLIHCFEESGSSCRYHAALKTRNPSSLELHAWKVFQSCEPHVRR